MFPVHVVMSTFDVWRAMAAHAQESGFSTFPSPPPTARTTTRTYSTATDLRGRMCGEWEVRVLFRGQVVVSTADNLEGREGGSKATYGKFG